MMDPSKLSGTAARVLIAMQTNSAQHKEQRITDIVSTSGIGYSTARVGLQQLIAIGAVTRQAIAKRNGSGYLYSLALPTQTGEKSDNLKNGFSAFPNPMPTTPPSHSLFDENDDLFDDDDDRQKFLAIQAIIGEFISEPTKSQLANALLPIICKCPAKISTIRSICERTKSEARWRNPAGVAVQRIRAMVINDQPDPLPLFPHLAAQPGPAAQRPARRPSSAKKSASYRRPQIMSSDDERAADEQAASLIRAELAARKATKPHPEVNP
jgi:hypothetical protein